MVGELAVLYHQSLLQWKVTQKVKNGSHVIWGVFCCFLLCFGEGVCKGNSGCFVENELEVDRSTKRESITIIQGRTWWLGLSGGR